MATQGTVVVVGGTSGLGLEIARHYAASGSDVVLTGRDAGRAAEIARQVGGRTSGIAVELTEPTGIAAQLADVGLVRYLVIAAVERDQNTARDYDVSRAMRLVTLKLIGYTEVVHALVDRLDSDSAIVLFGGLAKDRPYPGSTTVSTVNGGVVGMVRTLATELAPIRVNAIHPGIVGDSPYWSGKQAVLDGVLERTPTKRLVRTQDIVDAVRFLLENPSVNAIDLNVDGGWMIL
jgi:NAD(P)-dependent dehydrogenase (short-subunit alcohol dehydrogenase family)